MSFDWKRFWSDQSDPRHPLDDPDFFHKHGKELAIVFGDPVGKRVLELGCGSGALFEPMGFDKASFYRGVDFSEQMIATCRATRPGIDLVCADASKYQDSSTYDLILSNAVVQYFDRKMFRALVANASAMLAPGGSLLVGSILWDDARYAFYTNAFAPHVRAARIRDLARYARSVLAGDLIGRWYSPREVADVAKDNGMTAAFFGSLLYPYRFHTLLKSKR